MVSFRLKAGLPQKYLVRLTSSSSANTSKNVLLKVKEWEIVLQ